MKINKKIKKFIALIFVVLCAMNFTSCTSDGIDKRAIIEGMCISPSKSEFLYTFSLLQTNESGGDENLEIETEQTTINIKAKNMESALQKLKEKTAKEPFLGQNEYLILSAEFTKKEIKEQIEYFVKSNKINPKIAVMTADESAVKHLKSKREDSIFLTGVAEIEKEKNPETVTSLMDLSSKLSKDDNIFKICTLNANNKSITAGTQTVK